MSIVQMKAVSCVWIAWCFAAIAQDAKAQVWRFLPSDAYFHGSLTRDFIKSFDDKTDEETITLKYSVPTIYDTYHGYNTLEIESVPKRRRKRLAEVYEFIRAREPAIYEITDTLDGEKRKELNGMAFLVYNKSFDWRSYRVGLRYNENWAEEGSRFARVPRDFVPYPVLVEPLPKYVIEDWRNSDKVGPLNLRTPSFPGRSERDLEHTATTIANNQIQFIVTSHEVLESVRLNRAPSWFFVIEDEKVLRVKRDEDGQSSAEWSAQTQ